MNNTTRIKNGINRLINRFNLNLDTLTSKRQEEARLHRLTECGQFTRQAYPLLSGMKNPLLQPLINSFESYVGDLTRMMHGGASPGQYSPLNDFYRSPDAEVLYLMVRNYMPRTIVEIGSGHSTRIIRQAIADGNLAVQHHSIDPKPRSEIEAVVTHMHLRRFEEVEADGIIGKLQAGDILFIDSSHEVRVANDCAKLYCIILPMLPTGVIIHVHDIFLPYDYPKEFAHSYPHWGEQYLLQAYLSGHNHTLLWPGAFVQRTKPGIEKLLPFLSLGQAQSFWFITR